MSFILKEEVNVMVVTVTMRKDTFSTLLAGLYVTFHDADAYAVPAYAWLMLSEALAPYLNNWKYDVQSLEDWISNYLLVTAKEICTPEELKEFQKNTIYLELMNGNMTLIITGDILWE